MRPALIRPLAFALALLPTVAWAAGCAVEEARLDFGRLDPQGRGEPQAIGRITLRCEGAEGSRVRISLTGVGASGSGQRQMRDGTRQLSYRLYLDPAHQELFGDDTAGGSSLSVSLPRAGLPLTVPIYAVIPRGQPLQPGRYTDEISVTVDF